MQFVIDCTEQTRSEALSGIRELIYEIYGVQNSLELNSAEPSEGWDVWEP